MVSNTILSYIIPEMSKNKINMKIKLAVNSHSLCLVGHQEQKSSEDQENLRTSV